MKKKICLLCVTAILSTSSINAQSIPGIGNVGGKIDDLLGSGATDWINKGLGFFGYGSINDIMDKLFKGLNGLTEESALSVCYVPDIRNSSSKDFDICDYLNLPSIDVCSFAPNIPGFKKKGMTFNENEYLKTLCRDKTKKIQSAVTDIDIFGNMNKNGADVKYDEKYSTKKALADPNSIARRALTQGKQDELRLLITHTQKGGEGDIGSIKTADLAAPATFSAYREERNLITDALMEDYVQKAPSTFAQDMRNKVKDENNTDKAFNMAGKLTIKDQEFIDNSTNKRIQAYLDVYAQPDDFAMPTQEMIKLLDEDAKVEAIAKIKQQLKREALIISELKQVDNSRKNILNIIGRKAVIISRPFPREDTIEEIEKLVGGASNGGIVDGVVDQALDKLGGLL